MTSDDANSPKLSELLHPLGLTLCETLPLETAAGLLNETGAEFVVITNMSDHPIGVITHRDIETIYQLHPQRWSSKRCACAVKEQPRLQLSDPVDDVIEHFTLKEVRPLLVFDDNEALGVLRPTEVFQWCAQNRPTALDRLASQACRREPVSPG